MQETEETQVSSLGQEDPLEWGMATHSSIHAWRIPVDRGAWQAIVHRVPKSDQESNPRSLQWKRGVLTLGPPEKSPITQLHVLSLW